MCELGLDTNAYGFVVCVYVVKVCVCGESLCCLRVCCELGLGTDAYVLLCVCVCVCVCVVSWGWVPIHVYVCVRACLCVCIDDQSLHCLLLVAMTKKTQYRGTSV